MRERLCRLQNNISGYVCRSSRVRRPWAVFVWLRTDKLQILVQRVIKLEFPQIADHLLATGVTTISSTTSKLCGIELLLILLRKPKDENLLTCRKISYVKQTKTLFRKFTFKNLLGFKRKNPKFESPKRSRRCSGGHTASYRITTQIFSWRVKLTRRDAGHSPPSSAALRMNGSTINSTYMSSWRGQLYLYLYLLRFLSPINSLR